MELYNLKFKELMKLNREFVKTQFGKRARIFSLLPSMVFAIYMVRAMITSDFNSTNMILLFLGACITQFQYGNMLKDYIKSKK